MASTGSHAIALAPTGIPIRGAGKYCEVRDRALAVRLAGGQFFVVDTASISAALTHVSRVGRPWYGVNIWLRAGERIALETETEEGAREAVAMITRVIGARGR